MRNKRLGIVLLSVIMIGFWILEPSAFALTPKEIYQRVSPGVVFILASKGRGTESAGTGLCQRVAVTRLESSAENRPARHRKLRRGGRVFGRWYATVCRYEPALALCT